MLHVIHDHTRTDRLALLDRELHDVPYTLEPAVFSRTFEDGCAMAHRQVVAKLQASGAAWGFVGEDDVRLTAPGAWDRFATAVATLPDGWDICLAGLSSGTPKPRGDGWATVKEFSGLHMYAVSARAYAVFSRCPPDTHLDYWLGRQRLTVLCIWPIVAVQRPGWSANAGALVDYGDRFAKYPQWSNT